MTQKEFDDKMQEINLALYAEKHMYEVMIEQLDREKRRVYEQRDECNRKIHELKDQLAHNYRMIKEIKIKYHDMKHQLCIENPKDSMEDCRQETTE